MTEKNHDLIIQLRKVGKEYATGDGPFTALQDISFEIHKGEFLGITGKSGAGKTTLLNMISGVSRLTSGDVFFFGDVNGHHSPNGDGYPINKLNENELAMWRGKNMGIVYQSFELIPSLNLVENVMLPTDFLGTYHPLTSKQKALEILDLVGIVEHAYKIPAHISGGQKQRVAIARALVNDPQLIIADEPTGNLDTVTAETIFNIFESLVAEGKTVVMVTHDQSQTRRFTRHLQISDGRLISAEQGLPAVTSVGSEMNTQNQDALLSVHRANGTILETVKSPPDQTQPAIQLRAVNKTYENAAGKFVALKHVDLELNYGQFISIVGKSGSGKSTLLNMITGIDHPTSGEVVVGGKKIYELSESKRAMWRGKNMGVVFQFFQLLPTLTLLENTMLPMDYCNIYPFQERPWRAMELLKRVGLEAQAHKLPGSVSSGQQQSAAIARAMATDPDIILADEPTGNLDSRSAETVLSLFEKLSRQGKTIIIVTHDPTITSRTDQTIILSDGEIINPAVARALPLLTHPQMLAATQVAEKKIFEPGATIIRQGEPVHYFYMIEEGTVDILVSNPTCEEMNLARLGPGQFFGEVELTQTRQSIASVQVSKASPVRLAVLDKSVFNELLAESAETQQVIQEIAGERLAENLRQSEKNC